MVENRGRSDKTVPDKFWAIIQAEAAYQVNTGNALCQAAQGEEVIDLSVRQIEGDAMSSATMLPIIERRHGLSGEDALLALHMCMAALRAGEEVEWVDRKQGCPNEG